MQCQRSTVASTVPRRGTGSRDASRVPAAQPASRSVLRHRLKSTICKSLLKVLHRKEQLELDSKVQMTKITRSALSNYMWLLYVDAFRDDSSDRLNHQRFEQALLDFIAAQSEARGEVKGRQGAAPAPAAAGPRRGGFFS